MEVRKLLLAVAAAVLILSLGYLGFSRARQAAGTPELTPAVQSGVVSELSETGQITNRTSLATPTLQVVQPSQTSQAAGTLPGPTDTGVPIPAASATSTPAVTTAPVQPTATAPLAATSPSSCLLAALNLSTSSELVLLPGQAFSHAWRFQNTGTCTWSADFRITYSSGETLGAQTGLVVGQNVLPGEQVEVVTTLVAPSAPGSYTSQWLLLGPTGSAVAMDASGGDLAVRLRVVAQPTATATPGVAAVYGRLLQDGLPVQGGVLLTLEDQSYNTLAQVTVGQNGEYAFNGLPPSSQGYNVVFDQAANPGFPIEQVLSWGWIGPVSLSAGQVLQLPDFDISLLGFSPTLPEPEDIISLSTITPATPLQFRWSPYPGAVQYWVDLLKGEAQQPVWQSSYMPGTSTDFQGIYADGSSLQADEHWWGVGAKLNIGAYQMTVYGYLVKLQIEP